MNEVMRELINYMIAYGGLITLTFVVMNFLTKGFLLTYLRVKASQGRKVLTRIHSATDVYYKVGKWEDSFFKFKNRGKEQKSIDISEPVFKKLIHYTMGVGLVEVDETGNKFITVDFEAVKFAVDSGRLNTTLIRIKNRPVPKSKQEQIILLLLIVIAIAVGFAIFRLISLQEAITALGKLSGNI